MTPVYNNQQNQIIQPYSYGNSNRFIWTKGPEIAKSNPMAPDSLAFFIEEDESCVYIRKTDREGRTSSFDTYKRISSEKPTSMPTPQSKENNYISKEEFYAQNEVLVDMINELKGMIRQNNKPQNTIRQNDKPQSIQKRQVKNDESAV